MKRRKIIIAIGFIFIIQSYTIYCQQKGKYVDREEFKEMETKIKGIKSEMNEHNTRIEVLSEKIDNNKEMLEKDINRTYSLVFTLLFGITASIGLIITIIALFNKPIKKELKDLKGEVNRIKSGLIVK